MAKIVFTGIARRTVENWGAVFRELRQRGHDVRSLFFPHAADPDSAGLAHLGFDSVGSFPLSDSLWGATQATWRKVVDEAAGVLRAVAPDIVVLTTCHAGPELQLAAAGQAGGRRPLFVGCQHGLVQNWEGYWQNFLFDHLLVFGRMFQENAPGTVAGRVHVAGLAKLDGIRCAPRPAFSDDARPILFAGQRYCPAELVGMLQSLRTMSGREVLLRPHPEHRDAFLEAGLPVLDHEEPLVDRIACCSLVVSTGSTAILEAMAAGAPAVALPLERGSVYADAGIVPAAVDAASVLALAESQATATSHARRRAFLVGATGAASEGRVAMGVDAIERLHETRGV